MCIPFVYSIFVYYVIYDPAKSIQGAHGGTFFFWQKLRGQVKGFAMLASDFFSAAISFTEGSISCPIRKEGASRGRGNVPGQSELLIFPTRLPFHKLPPKV